MWIESQKYEAASNNWFEIGGSSTLEWFTPCAQGQTFEYPLFRNADHRAGAQFWGEGFLNPSFGGEGLLDPKQSASSCTPFSDGEIMDQGCSVGDEESLEPSTLTLISPPVEKGKFSVRGALLNARP